MNPTFLIVDLFCGAGGTTTGFSMAEYNGHKLAKIIACVNHDSNAIKSHAANHPDALHYTEDMRTLDLSDLIDTVQYWQLVYPDAKLILWASLECTNFSNAKGGQPRDGDSRTLADHLERYVFALNPDYIQIENVVEFKMWGPLDDNGKPIDTQKGVDFDRWRKHIKTFGYDDKWNEMNSADFGAYTSRNRLFGCFAKNGLPIVWPSPTHAKKGKLSVAHLKPWMPVREVLDMDDEGTSIFTRKKRLCDNTLNVIYKGIIKELKNTDNHTFLYKYYGCGDNLNSIDTAAGTITTKDRFAKVKCILRQFKTGYTSSLQEPIGALLNVPKSYILSFIMNRSHGGHCMSTHGSSPVIVARQDKAPLYLALLLPGVFDVDVSGFLDTDDYTYIDELDVYGPHRKQSIRIKIIEVMLEFGISDIKMRMLKILELLLIQGFPADYQLIGSQADQKKFIGNSVHPFVPEAWIKELAAAVFGLGIAA